ncbi:SDR family NAD(P)-dependent oxidoreductase [Bacillus amyloliquefaciens]|uniref:type I polyketide synthase n=1 Tax=Bacillus velezensis TaxID=492670 RepID=UPI001ABE6C30|nr:type I polyketide synthase [Bacillus velezensis]MBO3791850.1 SDR family NAD(P)-dependent oxidoreductase [Bacillus velezensis]
MKTDFISLSNLKAAAFTNQTPNVKKQKNEEGTKDISGDDIAIVGLSCRIGEANHVNEYWDLLLQGKEFIRDIPLNRKKDADQSLKNSGTKYSKDAAYTKIAYMDEIDKFDCDFFSILPNEAKLIDPRQRLFIETAWNALEDGGYGGGKLCGTNTGVYIGLSSDGSNEYFRLLEKGDQSLLGLATAGNIKSVIASRLSYILDFKGPAMVIDTACSSSLVALHTACQAIRNKDCDMALAGGVNIKVFPKTIEESRLNIGNSSSDFAVRTFDDSADGTNSGEGVAAVLLKPLAQAIRDHDQIYAVIKGSAVNQDGSSVGITAPNAAAQEQVIVDAWKNAKIDPKTITYIEAHGTGTKLGDPIEINALQRAFRKYTDRKQFCAVSSVKTNIGHLDSLAGIAGLIKAVMALKHKKIPPSLHFKVPNRNINFHESPVYVNDSVSAWESSGVYRCGISSFGLSGTNCHVILEEAPAVEKVDQSVLSEHIFTVSARTKTSLAHLLTDHIDYLKRETDVNLGDICYTANTGRLPNKYRLAMVISSVAELLEKLEFLSCSEWKTYREKNIYFQSITNQTKFIGKTHTDSVQNTQTIKNVIQRVRQDVSNIPISDLHILCEMYCDGANINFEDLYSEMNFQKVSLPTYKFSGKRLWAELVADGPSADEKKQSLLSNLAVQSLNLEVYISHLNVTDYWFLNEHKVNDSYVIPGTVYIETAREAGRKYFGEPVGILLKDVTFSNQLKVKANEVKEVHTIIKKKDSVLEFSVISKTGDKWIKHAEAVIAKEEPVRETYDIEDLKKSFNSVYVIQRNNHPLTEINTDEYKSVYHIEDTNRPESIVQVGGRWKCTNAIYRDDDRLLCELELPKEYESDFVQFSLHPAMMDCAVNAGTFTIDNETYLPYFYKEFKIYGSASKKFYSYIKKKSRSNGETGTFRIVLLNDTGEVFGEINNYIVKRVHKAAEKTKRNNIYHKLSWIRESDQSHEMREIHHPILLFKNNGCSLSEEIIRRLELEGKTVIVAEQGDYFSKIGSHHYTVSDSQEDYDCLVKALQSEKVSQIVHLMSISNEKDKNIYQLQKKISSGVDSLFYLTKSLVENTKNNIELMLFADLAHQVSGEEPDINPHNAAFFGFGKVIEKEYSRVSVRCIDLDQNLMAESILFEINSKKQSELVAYRDRHKYVQELQTEDLSVIREGKISIRKNGVYVITGGMGGLGLEMAKYLSSKENVQLILIGRSEQQINMEKGNNKKIDALKEIKESGSKVDYYKADVANESEMIHVFEEIKSKYNTIHGVIHSAGVSGDGFIFRKEKKVFDNVLRPKVNGTWILNELTKHEHLDFFIMFSSITALAGSMGQADYTAANAYLDSFAERRQRRRPDEKTVTINWCGWSDVGMLAEYIEERQKAGNEHKDENGFKTITSAEAIRAFDEVMQKDIRNVIIGEIDHRVLELNQDQIHFRLSPDILTFKEQAIVKKSVESKTDQTFSFSDIENKLMKAWIKVLGLEQISITDKFYDLGGDSISAIYLVKEIEKEWPSLIDVSDIFTYPSIKEMSTYLESHFSDQKSSDRIPEEDNEDDLDAILNKLASGEMEVSEANQIFHPDRK